MKKSDFKDIDAYIASFPEQTQALLQKVRATIKQAAPGAEERISYQMPTFRLNGNLVHFAAFKNHIGFYPAPRAIEEFAGELSAYKGAKGSVQFPLNRDMPLELISRMVKCRVKQTMEEAGPKSKKTHSNESFLSTLVAPARRALESKGITTLKELSKFSEAEILDLHGVGPSTIPRLISALEKEGLSFAKK